MTIGDKCPYCGRELLSGYLQSARQIIWSQEEKSISFRADEEGDLVVSRGIWEGSFADCRYCADCGVFLLERPVQPPKFGERLRGTFGRLRGGVTTEKDRARHLPCAVTACQKASQSFTAGAVKKSSIIFSGDMCGGENTSRPANVRAVCLRRTARALQSGRRPLCQKVILFDSLRPRAAFAVRGHLFAVQTLKRK